LAKAKKDRVEANAALADRKALRENEAGAFAMESGEAKANVSAMSTTSEALERRLAVGFLQTSGAAVLRLRTVNMDWSPSDRHDVASFLAQS